MIAAALGGQLSIAVEQNAITRVKEVPVLKDIYAYDDRLRALEGAHSVAVSAVLPVRGYYECHHCRAL